MKAFTYLILFLLSCTVIHAQSFTMNQGGATVKNYYVELPYEVINGKIIVSAEIAGGKHRFIFDTGAPVIVSKELSAQIKSEVISSNRLRDANGNYDSVSIVRLNGITLGNVSFNAIPAIGTLPELYKCWNVDGVIGSNMLRNSIVSIQSDKHLIIITDQANKLTLNKKHSVPLITNEGNNTQSDPVIKVMLGKKVSLTLEFDTGDGGFLRFSEDYMNQLSKYVVYEVIDKGYGAGQIGGNGLQDNADKYLLKISSLMIGEGCFNNVITETNKGGSAAIGSRLLDYGNVTLDFVNGRFYFDARNETNDLNEKHWPIRPTVIGNKLVAGIVWAKALNLVKPGEQIITVNKKSFPEVNLCDMLNREPIIAGTDSATVTIKDKQGKERIIQIVKE
jgi:hypothetical protein